MKTNKLSPILLATTFALSPGAALAQAGAPALLPVQGVLTDADGARLTTATNVTFTLYDAPADGTILHTETQAVSPEDGLFTVYLGTTATLDLATFRQSEVFLGIQLDGDVEMTPRLRLATAAYAAFAQLSGDAETLGGNAPSAFASALHAHAFSDLTDVPADLADGDDVLPQTTVETYARAACFDTAAEVTAALPDLDTDATDDLTTVSTFAGDVSGTAGALVLGDDVVGMAAANLPMGSGSTSMSGAGYGILNPNNLHIPTAFTPAADGTCLVIATASVHFVDTNDFGSMSLRVLARQGQGPGVGATRGSPQVSQTHVHAPGSTSTMSVGVFPVTANQPYFFGCQITLSSASLQGETLYCETTWMCS